MMSHLNYRLRLTLADTRVMTGQMLAFDKHMNLVLADCEEFRTVKAKTQDKKNKTQQMKRTLGLVILRGESITSISVDGPPPVPSGGSQQAKGALSAGPGIGRPAGRGIPVAPLGSAMPGLSGPVRGVGGPAAGMMQPRGNAPPSITAGPVSFARPPLAPGMMPPPPPAGFRPPPGMPPSGFRPPPPPPPGMGHPSYPTQPPPGFRPPRPGNHPPPGNQ
ncbi:Small nuclear ribonucleoprotein-associated protein B [Coemansia sp. RSA 1933]|nr:Small nuclear ribonucleoprotein-associated protein B [Coemansia sp. RSA 1933]